MFNMYIMGNIFSLQPYSCAVIYHHSLLSCHCLLLSDAHYPEQHGLLVGIMYCESQSNAFSRHENIFFHKVHLIEGIIYLHHHIYALHLVYIIWGGFLQKAVWV